MRSGRPPSSRAPAARAAVLLIFIGFKRNNRVLVSQRETRPAGTPWPPTTAGLVLALAGHMPSVRTPRGWPPFAAVRPCEALTVKSRKASSYPHLRFYGTPRVKFALGGRGGIGMFPTKAPTFAPGSRLSKTPSARKQFPNPIQPRLFCGGESVCVFLWPAALMGRARKRQKKFRKNQYYSPKSHTSPTLGVVGGGPVRYFHRLAWAGSPAPSRDGEVG